MAKIFFVAAHRPNRSPSQRYRFEQYFDLLRQKGHTYHLAYLINENDDNYFYHSKNPFRKALILIKAFLLRWQHTKQAKAFDYIFIQREAFMIGTALFERRFKRLGKPLIFDFDDAIWKLDVSDGNKHWAWLKYPKKIENIIRLADKTVAGNQYLAEYASQFCKNVEILPTTIDTQWHFPKPELRNQAVINIGWSGSITTIKHFKYLEPTLIRLKLKYQNRIRFTVYGSEKYQNEALEIKGIPWSSDSEVDVLNSFDIGLMPLPDDDWSKGKCGLKGLSYMACGVATIMSPVGVNTEIITHGVNGLLASNENDWFNIISLLIDDADQRIRLGMAGRERVESSYSKQSQSQLFLKLFS
jgi:glycosyltransferase involved in cell wall biosynthesis